MNHISLSCVFCVAFLSCHTGTVCRQSSQLIAESTDLHRQFFRLHLIFSFLHHLLSRLPTHVENQIIRSYTPVPSKYYASASSASSSPADLLFIIKTYENGALTSLLKSSLEHIRLFLRPRGALNLHRIRSCTRFAMLAAGSGITPMYTVVEHLLDRRENRM